MESKELPFTSPSGLLERIFELEDRNLSLIGHFQQSEEEFEEIKDLFHSTAVKLGLSTVEKRFYEKRFMKKCFTKHCRFPN